MADERNFRSHFYEKVGFIGVEEKKLIEVLLKDQPIDRKKLSQLCLKCPVPALHRSLVWKVLLEILPTYQESHDFMTSIRQDQYNDLHHSLCMMNKINDNTPLPVVFLKMYHLEHGTLLFDEETLLHNPDSECFQAMAAAVLEVTEDTVDAYWISSRFYKTQQRWKDILHILSDRTEYYLKKEDPDGKLYDKINKLNILGAIPISKWFSCCYAGVLPDTSFERIWDKLIGGSCKISVFVAVAIFLTFRRPIMSMNSAKEICDYLKKVPPDSADIVVGKAIELWQKHGSLLLPSGIKADSPVIIDRPPP